jgi:hypothetical protein
MEYSLNEAGKFIVTLNGTLYTDCQTDIDCPGQAICLKNVTWSAYSSMCTCHIGSGRGGPECEELGQGAIGLLVVTVLVLVVGIVNLIVGCVGTVAGFLNEKKRYTRAHWTTFLGLLTGIATILLMSLFIARISGNCPLETFGTIKTECHSQFALVAVSLHVGIVLLTILSVSLTWLDIAVRVRTLSHAGGSTISKVIYAVAVLFVLAVAILLFTAMESIMYILFMLCVLGTAVTYFVGAASLKRLLKNNENEKTFRILKEIENYALTISLGSLVRIMQL